MSKKSLVQKVNLAQDVDGIVNNSTTLLPRGEKLIIQADDPDEVSVADAGKDITLKFHPELKK